MGTGERTRGLAFGPDGALYVVSNRTLEPTTGLCEGWADFLEGICPSIGSDAGCPREAFSRKIRLPLSWPADAFSLVNPHSLE
jgi:hypothetical protein